MTEANNTQVNSKKGNPIIRLFGFIWRLIERLVKGIQVLIFLVVVLMVVSIVAGTSGGGIQVPESAAMIVAPIQAPGDKQLQYAQNFHGGYLKKPYISNT